MSDPGRPQFDMRSGPEPPLGFGQAVLLYGVR